MLTILSLAIALQAAALGPPSAEFFRETRTALDTTLFDYPSARFRDVHGHQHVICGYVNSKNRMGAYVGWTRFAAVKFDEPADVYVETPGEEDIMVETFCGDEGKFPATDYTARIKSGD